MVIRRPLDKLELSDELGFQPNTIFHLGRGETLAPAAAMLLWPYAEIRVTD